MNIFIFYILFMMQVRLKPRRHRGWGDAASHEFFLTCAEMHQQRVPLCHHMENQFLSNEALDTKKQAVLKCAIESVMNVYQWQNAVSVNFHETGDSVI